MIAIRRAVRESLGFVTNQLWDRELFEPISDTPPLPAQRSYSHSTSSQCRGKICKRPESKILFSLGEKFIGSLAPQHFSQGLKNEPARGLPEAKIRRCQSLPRPKSEIACISELRRSWASCWVF